MLTREQIEEIQAESREKYASAKNLLKEKGIPDHQYFLWERIYGNPDVPEGLLPVAGGGLQAAMAAQMPVTVASSRGKSRSDALRPEGLLQSSPGKLGCSNGEVNQTDIIPTLNECNRHPSYASCISLCQYVLR